MCVLSWLCCETFLETEKVVKMCVKFETEIRVIDIGEDRIALVIQTLIDSKTGRLINESKMWLNKEECVELSYKLQKTINLM